MQYVSRAGEKLKHGLDVFEFSPKGLVCADFGSNTGGFVDCLLQNGAEKIYAVETGYGVLDWKLRTDKRVVVMEKTNAMHAILPEKMDFISVDTSWTKLEKIIPNVLRNLKDSGRIIVLVKPQYEAPQNMLRKGRISDEFIPHILQKVRIEMGLLGLEVLSETESPIVGEKAGNREFLLFLKRL